MSIRVTFIFPNDSPFNLENDIPMLADLVVLPNIGDHISLYWEGGDSFGDYIVVSISHFAELQTPVEVAQGKEKYMYPEHSIVIGLE